MWPVGKFSGHTNVPGLEWLAGCRRLHCRYKRNADHFLAITSIACTLICYRRLTK
ncbi:hypothetical protein ACFXJ6_29205 [Streptomyces sp. NPDC059218]|uniref:hypothetical protein n=1 Tax=unclassified Streptomyces TaxID=2593676 RepID=UPI0036AC0290